MTQASRGPVQHGGFPIRLLAWAAAAALIAAPWVAMRMDVEGVDWTAFDFVFAAAILFGALAIYELAQWFVRRRMARLVVAGGLLLAVMTVWAWAVN